MHRIKQEYLEVKEEFSDKDRQIEELHDRCQELMKAHAIEVPLTWLQRGGGSGTGKKKAGKSAVKKDKEGGTAAKKGLKFIKEINEEVAMMMDAHDESDIFKLPLSLQHTIKKKKSKKEKAALGPGSSAGE